MNKLIVPELVYIILFYGGILVCLISVIMIICGIIRKNNKRYFINWSIVFFIALIIVFLTATGIIVANTMFGG